MTPARSWRPLIAALCGIPVLVGASAAQEPGDTLRTVLVPPIVVSVSRVETDPATSASAVTVVTREEIERRQLRTVLETLRGVPGVSVVQTGGPGSATSVFLRGAGSDHALVLLDGIEMNDPSGPGGGYDLATLGTDAVERIEILRGPQGTIHGSHAMGGVVNVVTRRGEGPPSVEARAEGGSHGTGSGTFAFQGASEGWSWSATMARRVTDGFSAAPEAFGNTEEDGSRTTDLALRVERQAGPVVLAFVGHLDDTDTDLDANGPTGDDPNRRLEDREIGWKVEARHGEAADRWRSTLSITRATHDRTSLDDPDADHPGISERGAFEGASWKLAWLNDLALARWARLVAGAETEQERAETSFRSDGPFGPFESAFSERTTRTSGVFSEVAGETRGGATLAIGGRLDGHERFGSVLTARVAAAVPLGSKGTRLRATWGSGFRSPTLFQLFDPQFGTPELEPEESRGGDIGLDQTLGRDRARLSATWFSSRFDDLIVFTNDGYRNEDEASMRGVETAATALVGDALRIDAAYTWTRAESETGPDAGRPLIRRPRHEGSLDFAWIGAHGPEIALGVRAVGEREDLDFSVFPSERVALDPYAVWRIAVAWDARPSVRLFGRIENLFDAEYVDVLDFATSGRAAYVGATVRP